MAFPVQLRDDEEVLTTIRRHPIGLIGRLIGVVVVVLIAGIFWWLIRANGGTLATVADIVMLLVVLGGAFMAFVYWYRYMNDLWLITNERLIDSTKSTPFNHTVTSANLPNIQDINAARNGLFQTMFDYGDVLCQTASASAATFEFLGVAKPSQVLDQIDDARRAAMHPPA